LQELMARVDANQDKGKIVPSPWRNREEMYDEILKSRGLIKNAKR
jgi:hypothetical protein